MCWRQRSRHHEKQTRLPREEEGIAQNRPTVPLKRAQSPDRVNEIANSALVEREYQENKGKKWNQSLPIDDSIACCSCLIRDELFERLCESERKNEREGSTEKSNYFRYLSILRHWSRLRYCSR